MHARFQGCLGDERGVGTSNGGCACNQEVLHIMQVSDRVADSNRIRCDAGEGRQGGWLRGHACCLRARTLTGGSGAAQDVCYFPDRSGPDFDILPAEVLTNRRITCPLPTGGAGLIHSGIVGLLLALH